MDGKREIDKQFEKLVEKIAKDKTEKQRMLNLPLSGRFEYIRDQSLIYKKLREMEDIDNSLKIATLVTFQTSSFNYLSIKDLMRIQFKVLGLFTLMNSKPSPRLMIYKYDTLNRKLLVFESEIQNNTSQPQWKVILLQISNLCGNPPKTDNPLLFEIIDGNDLLAFVELSLKDIYCQFKYALNTKVRGIVTKENGGTLFIVSKELIFVNERGYIVERFTESVEQTKNKLLSPFQMEVNNKVTTKIKSTRKRSHTVDPDSLKKTISVNGMQITNINQIEPIHTSENKMDSKSIYLPDNSNLSATGKSKSNLSTNFQKSPTTEQKQSTSEIQIVEIQKIEPKQLVQFIYGAPKPYSSDIKQIDSLKVTDKRTEDSQRKAQEKISENDHQEKIKPILDTVKPIPNASIDWKPIIEAFKSSQVENSDLNTLLELLEASSFEELNVFSKSDGIHWLFDFLAYILLYKLKSKKSSPQDEELIDLLIHCIGFISLKYPESISLIVSHSFYLEHMVKSMEFLSIDQRKIIFNIICLTYLKTEVEFRANIFGTFTSFKELSTCIQELVSDLEYGDDNENKLAFVKYINVILDCASSLNERRIVRKFLVSSGSQIALGALMEVPNLSLEISNGISYYFENLQADKIVHRKQLEKSQDWNDIMEFTKEILEDHPSIQVEFASLLNAIECTLEKEQDQKLLKIIDYIRKVSEDIPDKQEGENNSELFLNFQEPKVEPVTIQIPKTQEDTVQKMKIQETTVQEDKIPQEHMEKQTEETQSPQSAYYSSIKDLLLQLYDSNQKEPPIDEDLLPPPPPPLDLLPPLTEKPKKNEKKLRVVAPVLENILSIEETVFASFSEVKLERNYQEDLLKTFTERKLTEEEMREIEEKKHQKEESDKEKEKLLPKVLDQKRCQAIGILLKKFNVKAQTMVNFINSGGNDSSISLDFLEQIGTIFKAAQKQKRVEAEKTSLLNYDESKGPLVSEELFLTFLYQIPRVEAKINCLLFRLDFENDILSAQKCIKSIDKGLKVLEEEKWKSFLMHVLSVSNLLYSPSGKKFKGFQLSSLTKLVNTKSPTNKQLSLLSYLISKLDVNTLSFLCEIVHPLVREASSAMISFQTLFPKVFLSLTQLSNEINNCTTSTEKEFKTSMENFKKKVYQHVIEWHSKLQCIDEKLKYYGDNKDLGLQTQEFAVVDLVWNPIKDAHPSLAKASERDKQRAAFFGNLAVFTVSVQQEFKLLDEKRKATTRMNKKKEADEKRKATKAEKEKELQQKQQELFRQETSALDTKEGMVSVKNKIQKKARTIGMVSDLLHKQLLGLREKNDSLTTSANS